MTLSFSRAVVQCARCRTQTAFLFATLWVIFFKALTSHTRIGIPLPQCPKVLPVVLSQDKAVAVLSRKAVVEIDSTQEAGQEKGQDSSNTRPMDRGPGEIPCESVGGQYIEAGEPTFKESVDRNSTCSTKCKHYGFVKRKQNASAIACGQQ